MQCVEFQNQQRTDVELSRLVYLIMMFVCRDQRLKITYSQPHVLRRNQAILKLARRWILRTCWITFMPMDTRDSINIHIWQVKKIIFNFAIRHFQKKNLNLTIDSLSRGIHAADPQLLTYRPQILRGFRIWAPFRVPGPERRVKRFRCFRIRRR